MDSQLRNSAIRHSPAGVPTVSTCLLHGAFFFVVPLMDHSNKQRLRSRSHCLQSDSVSDKKVNSDDQQSSRQWRLLSEGFPPGVTVDELKQYRRKRPSNLNRPADNLLIEEGGMKALKTEYCRRFQVPVHETVIRSSRPSGVEDWSLDRSIKPGTPLGEYKEQFVDFPRQRPRVKRPDGNLKPNDGTMDVTTENLEKFVPFLNVERSQSLRRKTALKPEGDLETETESRKEFHAHEKIERVGAMKRPSNLKVEGMFETLTSEQKGKYVAYLLSRRPALTKRDTQLKLIGDLAFATECRAKYVDPGTIPKASLRKRTTSLKLDGEADYTPEYRRNFIDFPRARPCMVRPRGQLYSEGELDLGTESHSQYIQQPLTLVPKSTRAENQIRSEGDMVLNPEYREQFISHERSKSEIFRRRDNLNLEGVINFETEKDKYVPSALSRKNETQEHQSPSTVFTNSEYHSQYIDFPRRRPHVTRPSANLLSNGPSEMTTEKSSQYRSYGTMPRTTPRTRPSNLRPEGGFEGEAEYKNKYIEFPVSYKRTPKPCDSFSREYSSFKVLNKETSPCLEPLLPSSSPSPDRLPSYRLEVLNVDDKPLGFHRSPERVFPPKATTSRTFASPERQKAAFEAAKKRKQSHERLPSRCLSQIKPLIDVNGNEPSFTVLDNRPDSSVPQKDPSLSQSGGSALSQPTITV